MLVIFCENFRGQAPDPQTWPIVCIFLKYSLINFTSSLSEIAWKMCTILKFCNLLKDTNTCPLFSIISSISEITRRACIARWSSLKFAGNCMEKKSRFFQLPLVLDTALYGKHTPTQIAPNRPKYLSYFVKISGGKPPDPQTWPIFYIFEYSLLNFTSSFSEIAWKMCTIFKLS